MFDKVETLLKKNETIAKIEATLEKACAKLPKKFAQQCNGLVEKYLGVTIKYITAGITPQQGCELLSLCKHSSLAAGVSLFNFDKLFGGKKIL